jgi:hypothetical protein
VGGAKLRAGQCAAYIAVSLIAWATSSLASAGMRSVLISYRPPSGSYAGVALYHAATRADLDEENFTRVDLGHGGVDNQGVVSDGSRATTRASTSSCCERTTRRGASRPTRTWA